MAVNINVPTINGITLNTKNKYVKDDIVVNVGIPYYDGSASVDVTPLEDAIVSGKTIDTYTNNRITKVAGYKFRDANIKVFNSTSVDNLGAQAFYGSVLEECNIPNLVSLSSGSAFHSCKIKKAYFPKLTSLGTSTFYGCTALLYAHIGKPTTINGRAFEGCTNLQAVIIERTSVSALNSSNTFSSSGISNGTGFIYVPDELVDSYKGATNWSTYADQIKPISELPQEVKDELGME